MSGIRYIANVLNQKGAPAVFEDTLANRPAAGYTGRIFISTDTFVIQRDNGTTWDSIGGGGITGTGAAGQVTFFTGASAVSGDNGLFWDNVNKRLGINTITPGVRLDIHGTGVIAQFNGTTTNNSYLDFQNAGVTQWRIGNTYNGGTRLFQILDVPGSKAPISILNSVAIGAIGIFNSNPYYALHIGDGTNQCQVYCESIGSGTGGGASFAARTGGTTAIQIGNKSNVTGGAYDVNAMFLFNNILTFTTFSGTYIDRATINATGQFTIVNRLNVNNASDNANFELNNNGNLNTSGLSAAFISLSSNTTLTRTMSGILVTANCTLTLPTASGLNNIYYIFALTGVTVTINRSGSDTITNKIGTTGLTTLSIVGGTSTMLYIKGGDNVIYQFY